MTHIGRSRDKQIKNLNRLQGCLRAAIRLAEEAGKDRMGKWLTKILRDIGVGPRDFDRTMSAYWQAVGARAV